jgi:Tfp pilus assembly pilus retraction ATPase PilT
VAVELAKLLGLLVEKQAPELVLQDEARPAVRLRGEWRHLNLPPLTSDDTTRYLESLAPEAARHELAGTGRCEFGYRFDARAHFFITVMTYERRRTVTLRRVPSRPAGLEDEA